MPTENRIDCPALHKRSESYPYGDRVPRTVRMLKTVTPDLMPGIGLAYIKGNAPIAKNGQSYQVWTNSHGAVAAVMPDGQRLGLRPTEFEVDSWHDHQVEPLRAAHCFTYPGEACPGDGVNPCKKCPVSDNSKPQKAGR